MEFLDYLDEEIKRTYKPDDSKAKFKIKDIFKDHWLAFLEDEPTLNIRPIVYEEVEKMIGLCYAPKQVPNNFVIYA